jgi:putative spermidine/putrescine transport system permease protein
MAREEMMVATMQKRQGEVPRPTGIRASLLLVIPLAGAFVLLVLPLLALIVRVALDKGTGFFLVVVKDPVFLDSLQRTLALSLTVTVACTVIGSIYALALVCAPSIVGKTLLAVLLSSFWISLLVRTFGWVLLFQPNGVLDQLLQKLGLTHENLNLFQTAPAMYPAMIHIMLPYFVLPVYAACLRIDSSLLRAGESLGAGPLAVLLHVIFPPLRPAVFAASSLVFMLSLAFYVTPLLIGGPTQLTVSTLIDREFSVQVDLGAAAAMGVVLLLIVMVIYTIVDRYVSLIPGREAER